jgi:hypothetical protein
MRSKTLLVRDSPHPVAYGRPVTTGDNVMHLDVRDLDMNGARIVLCRSPDLLQTSASAASQSREILEAVTCPYDKQ